MPLKSKFRKPFLVTLGIAGLALLLLSLNGTSPAEGARAVYRQGLAEARRIESLIASYNIGSPSPITPIETRVAPADGMAQVFVPAGEFLMGTDEKPVAKSRPAHTVYIDAFWIDQTEVTNAMYAKCVQAGACRAPIYEDLNPAYEDPRYADYPVVFVKWTDAEAYCQWGGRRLPTEAEWEKAARGTDGRLYPWGDAAPDARLANFDHNIDSPVPVDRYPLGASPYGALNMAGNVREWVADWFSESYYNHTPLFNPLGPTQGETRALRGGSYLDDARELRVFNRYGHSPRSPGINRGFRCAGDEEK